MTKYNDSCEHLVVVALKEEIPTLPRSRHLLITGVGKVNASVKLTKRLAQDKNIRTVINYGSCGSIRTDVKGIVDCARFVEGERDKWTEEIDTGRIGETCCTQDYFVTSAPKPKCDVVDMEAYALAKACKELGVEFFCYKYISDYVGLENQLETWEENVSDGEELFKQILLDKHNL